jgi:aspartate/methionine/tyrosine aminotransferase
MLSKLPHVGTTIFTTMSKMAGEYNAINLSQGFPNFPTDEILIDLRKKKCRGKYSSICSNGRSSKFIRRDFKLGS